MYYVGLDLVVWGSGPYNVWWNHETSYIGHSNLYGLKRYIDMYTCTPLYQFMVLIFIVDINGIINANIL